VRREELTALHDAIDLALALPGRKMANRWRRGAPYGAASGDLTAVEAAPSVPETPAAYARWIRNINDYERKETTVVEGLRYG
jgi:hypothetical protein